MAVYNETGPLGKDLTNSLNRTLVAKVTTGASSITNIQPISFNKTYDSGNLITTAVSTTAYHNLGYVPQTVTLFENGIPNITKVISCDEYTLTWTAIAGTSRVTAS